MIHHRIIFVGSLFQINGNLPIIFIPQSPSFHFQSWRDTQYNKCTAAVEQMVEWKTRFFSTFCLHQSLALKNGLEKHNIANFVLLKVFSNHKILLVVCRNFLHFYQHNQRSYLKNAKASYSCKTSFFLHENCLLYFCDDAVYEFQIFVREIEINFQSALMQVR